MFDWKTGTVSITFKAADLKDKNISNETDLSIFGVPVRVSEIVPKGELWVFNSRHRFQDEKPYECHPNLRALSEGALDSRKKWFREGLSQAHKDLVNPEVFCRPKGVLKGLR